MIAGHRTAAAPGRRARLLLSGVAVLAVLAGGSLYLARGVFSAGPAAGGRPWTRGPRRPDAARRVPAPAPRARRVAVAVPPRW